jgi:hypothetical protein
MGKNTNYWFERGALEVEKLLGEEEKGVSEIKCSVWWALDDKRFFSTKERG